MMHPYRIFLGVLVGLIPLFLIYSITSNLDCLEIKTTIGQEKCYEMKGYAWIFTLPLSVSVIFVALGGLGFEQHYYERPCGKCGKELTIGTNPCPKCGETLFWLPERQDTTPHPPYWWGMKEKERLENEAIIQRYGSMPFLSKIQKVKKE